MESANRGLEVRRSRIDGTPYLGVKGTPEAPACDAPHPALDSVYCSLDPGHTGNHYSGLGDIAPWPPTRPTQPHTVAELLRSIEDAADDEYVPSWVADVLVAAVSELRAVLDLAPSCAEAGCDRPAELGPYTGSLDYCRAHWGIADREADKADTSVEHNAELTWTRAPIIEWLAVCRACGWRGRSTGSRDEALADAIAHNEGAR